MTLIWSMPSSILQRMTSIAVVTKSLLRCATFLGLPMSATPAATAMSLAVRVLPPNTSPSLISRCPVLRGPTVTLGKKPSLQRKSVSIKVPGLLGFHRRHKWGTGSSDWQHDEGSECFIDSLWAWSVKLFMPTRYALYLELRDALTCSVWLLVQTPISAGTRLIIWHGIIRCFQMKICFWAHHFTELFLMLHDFKRYREWARW